MRSNNSCEYCGKKVGEIKKVDAHHLQSRRIKNNPLKYDIMNGISLCPLHHKFSTKESFHNSPIVTITWLIKNMPNRYNYVLEHYNDNVILNKGILLDIENKLKIEYDKYKKTI